MTHRVDTASPLRGRFTGVAAMLAVACIAVVAAVVVIVREAP